MLIFIISISGFSSLRITQEGCKGLSCAASFPQCPMEQPASALLGRCFGLKPTVLLLRVSEVNRTECLHPFT